MGLFENYIDLTSYSPGPGTFFYLLLKRYELFKKGFFYFSMLLLLAKNEELTSYNPGPGISLLTTLNKFFLYEVPNFGITTFFFMTSGLYKFGEGILFFVLDFVISK